MHTMHRKRFVSIALICLVALSSLFFFLIMNGQEVLPAHAASSITSYEAESSANTLAGQAKIAACSACSGGKKVGYIGLSGTLQFNNVQASSAGTTTITIYYVDGDAGRSAQMSVNGGATTTIAFHGTNNANWNFVQNLTLSPSLKTGSNTIKFSNATAAAPDLDRITVSTSTNVNPSYSYSSGDESLWRSQSRLHVRRHNAERLDIFRSKWMGH